ncbi:MAG: BTAD domain-containing putative transcriptional regulator [Acidimicrobiales bacterium]|nr:BTAD domain-containing putative transcriptional regulator [Acidimicrobiales bacterium]
MAENGVLQVRVLGSVTVEIDGFAVSVGGARPALLLARLAVSAPAPVRVEQLIDAIWGDDASEKAANTLQVHVSNLRRTLKPAGDPAQLLRTVRNGYELALTADQLDILAFEEHTATARRAAGAGDHEGAAAAFTAALAIPRGEPLADLLDHEWAANEATVIGERLAGVWREWAQAELDAGRHLAALPSLEQRLRDVPLDEGVAGLLVLALYRAGRQTDALRVVSDMRRRLGEEIGVDPGPELADLESRILAHDERLLGAVGAIDLPASTRVVDDRDRGFLVIGGRRHVLARGLMTIGRRDDQDIVIDDADVSREHAVVERIATGFRIVDRGSTNGIWVNGVQVDDADLTDGDELLLGSTVATFRST